MLAMRVLFIPGFMQRGDAWRPVAELLPQRYPSSLLDHREHDFEGRLAEIAEHGAGAVLAGYSLGGRLALRAALRDPGRYSGLITIGAGAGIEEPGARASRRAADERLATWMEGTTIEEIVGVWERQAVFADQAEALVAVQRAGRLSHEPHDLALLLRSAGQGVLEPVWERLEQLDLPLLAIAGARDETYVQAAQRLAEDAGHGQLAIVEKTGHAPQLERPGEVAGLLGQFVEAIA